MRFPPSPVAMRIALPAFAGLWWWLLASVAVGAGPVPTTRPVPVTRPAAFTYAGHPIHPLLVKEFCGWMSDDGPIVRLVDVSAAFGTDQFEAPVTENDGIVRCDVPHTQPAEWFAYRHLGKLGDGTDVLVTMWSTGGTGVFMDLLLVRVSRMQIGSKGQQHQATLATLVDFYPLGDRDSGQIEVKSDCVVIGTSQHREKPVVLERVREHTSIPPPPADRHLLRNNQPPARPR